MQRVAFISILALAGIRAHGQPGHTAITFEAAAIKPFKDGTPIVGSGCNGGPGSDDPGRVICQYATLRMLLVQAYQVKAQEIVGPGWLDSAHFDVAAKVPLGAAREQVPVMFRNLLAERFKVVTHRETKLLPGYAITIGKGGFKADPAAPAPEDAAATGAPAGGKQAVGKDGFPMLQRSFTATGPIILYRQGRARLQASEATIAQLAEALSRQLGSVVVDNSGLDGKYGMTLYWTPDEGEPGARPPSPSATENSVPESASQEQNIFTAMDQQLGLKLTRKQLPREVIVIDQAERVPTEN